MNMTVLTCVRAYVLWVWCVRGDGAAAGGTGSGHRGEKFSLFSSSEVAKVCSKGGGGAVVVAARGVAVMTTFVVT